MPSLLDRAVEASFKPTEGGYEFRFPNPWLLGSWRRYLVNEAQKERLADFLRQRQRFLLRLLAATVLIAAALTVWLQVSPAADPALAGLIIILALAAMLALALVQHFSLMRRIEPVLAGLSRIDEPVTLHEQIVGVAAAIGTLPVALGGMGGVLIAAANFKSLVLAFSEGSVGFDLVWSVLGLLVGVGLAGYFGYLGVLKRKLKRKPN
jgi:hypothetical protein